MLLFLFTARQAPKLPSLCQIVDEAEAGYLIGSKVLAYIEYPWEQVFLELFPRQKGVKVASLYSSLTEAERAERVRLFNDPSSSLKVLLPSYKTGGVGLNLPNACWYAVLLNCPASKGSEEQAASSVKDRRKSHRW